MTDIFYCSNGEKIEVGDIFVYTERPYTTECDGIVLIVQRDDQLIVTSLFFLYDGKVIKGWPSPNDIELLYYKDKIDWAEELKDGVCSSLHRLDVELSSIDESLAEQILIQDIHKHIKHDVDNTTDASEPENAAIFISNGDMYEQVTHWNTLERTEQLKNDPTFCPSHNKRIFIKQD